MPEIQEVLPKYLQIAAHIREQISQGVLRPGDEVPSERELSVQWRVARPTASRALETLRNQGLVQSRRGAGTFVRPSSAASYSFSRLSRVGWELSADRSADVVELLSVEIVPGPDHVVAALGLMSNANVICRTSVVRGAGGQELEIYTSWFAAALADVDPGLLTQSLRDDEAARGLGPVAGREPATGRDQVAARLATSGERHVLNLGAMSPVLVYRVVVLDAAEQPLRLDDVTCAPDRWYLHHEYSLLR